MYPTILFKRLFKVRMSQADLFRSVESLLADYSWMEKYGKGWIRDYLVNNSYPDGTSYNEIWRRDFKACVGMIAAEPTQILQRQKLLSLSVNANSWIALDKAVTADFRSDVAVWKDCVIQSDRFKHADETKYSAILTQEGLFNVLSAALLSAMGLICFGLMDADSSSLTFYHDMRVHAFGKRLGTISNVKSLTDADPEAGVAFMAVFKERVTPHWKREDSFFRQLGDDISSRRPIEPYGAKWEILSNEYNAALQSLKDEIDER